MRLGPVPPSLNFLLVLLVFCGTGAMLWHEMVGGRLAVVLFVLSGWIVSLCLHEFAHAFIAYLGGDEAIAETGYLDLDPLRYTDPTLSLVLPVVFALIGGVGLPGGLVYIRTGRLRTKVWASAVSAAGPLMSLAFLIFLAVLYRMLEGNGRSDIAAGLGILAYFETTAILLCCLPFPGLDAFGVIRPFLPRDVAFQAERLGIGAFYVLFLLLWLTPIGAFLSDLAWGITVGCGIDQIAIGRGYGMVRLL